MLQKLGSTKEATGAKEDGESPTWDLEIEKSVLLGGLNFYHLQASFFISIKETFLYESI